MNAGRKAGSPEKLEALVAAASETQPGWMALYVSEFDGHFGTLHSEEWSTRAGHSVKRHWPGEGSVSMAWIIRASARRRIRSVLWRGRAGSLTLRAEEEASRSSDEAGNNMCWVGIHGAHGDVHAASMHDAAVLCQQRVRPSSVAILGDFNADMRARPVVQPRDGQPEGPRETDRESVKALAAALGLQVCLPERMSSGPGGSLEISGPGKW